MKKRTVFVLAAAVLLLAAATAFGARAAMAAGPRMKMKIGYVDLQKALNESNAGQAAKTDLKALMKKMQKAIDKKVSRTEELRSELKKQASVLSPAAKKAKQAEIAKLMKETQALIESSNTNMQKERQKKEVAILKKIKAAVDSIGAKEHYTVILPADVILYSGSGMEITDQVINLLNQESASQAPVANAPSGGKK